jgi:hypothetical protein
MTAHPDEPASGAIRPFGTELVTRIPEPVRSAPGDATHQTTYDSTLTVIADQGDTDTTTDEYGDVAV